MNALEEFDHILRFGYNSEKLLAVKSNLDSYLQTCPEEDKAKCQMNIELAERLIAESKEVDKLRQQYNLLHGFVLENKQLGPIELEYIEPYRNSYGVDIKVGRYIMELVYKPIDEPEKNEVRTKFYFNVDDLYKSFMLKKDAISSAYPNIQYNRRDYYPISVRWDNWGDLIVNTIKVVENDPRGFLQMCEDSCPFNPDGSHKFKFWKTKAAVEVSYDANTGIIQGIKKGETSVRSHVVGSNGSFRFFEKGDYVLKIVLDCLAGEKPIKYECFIDIDDYMRQLKEKKGWGRNMPYNKVNAALSGKVDVITYDHSLDRFEQSARKAFAAAGQNSAANRRGTCFKKIQFILRRRKLIDCAGKNLTHRGLSHIYSLYGIGNDAVFVYQNDIAVFCHYLNGKGERGFIAYFVSACKINKNYSVKPLLTDICNCRSA